MNDLDLMNLILNIEANKEVVVKGGYIEKPGSQVAAIKDNVLLTPRETKNWVVSVYEKKLGRKMSKKEANLAMSQIKKYLTVHTDEETEVYSKIHGRKVLVSGITTWDENTPSEGIL